MDQRLSPAPDHHYYFVTGKLAEAAVRSIVDELADRHGFAYSIGVMPITVAALMTPRWIARHIEIPNGATHMIVPGYCDNGLTELANTVSIPVVAGPRDCRELPELFGDQRIEADFGEYSIEILAEINHAPRRSVKDVVAEAGLLRESGADLIDFGCDPGARCREIGTYIRSLCDEGLTVSVDTFDPWEAEEAVRHGASLVLSVNSSNRKHAADWGVEVVAIPDVPEDFGSLVETVDFLKDENVPLRIDPILEPIGAGFMRSLERYAAARRQFPDVPMMMGIGNLTELTDVDSAGVNLMLLGICQELGVGSVLTTQVINWARTSVMECDIARRLTHYSIKHGVPPKRLSKDLVLLRDAKLLSFSDEELEVLRRSIRDNNYRILAQDNSLHLLAAGLHLQDVDPFRLFDRLMCDPASSNVDSGHAFYLGYELAKAELALQLGKQYQQDQALNWGYLTKAEDHHRLKRSSRHRTD